MSDNINLDDASLQPAAKKIETGQQRSHRYAPMFGTAAMPVLMRLLLLVCPNGLRTSESFVVVVVAAFHGFTASTPVSTKSSTLRVASPALQLRQIAARPPY